MGGSAGPVGLVPRTSVASWERVFMSYFYCLFGYRRIPDISKKERQTDTEIKSHRAGVPLCNTLNYVFSMLM